MRKKTSLLIFTALAILIQACAAFSPAQGVTAAPSATPPAVSSTPTRAQPTRTEIPTATEIPPPSETPAPRVTISAMKGNLFIRRGPDMAYNPIDVLYKGATVEVHARDVLSKWAQVTIPNSTEMGWVSLQTEYSQVQGEISDLPEFKVTDWPLPGYVENCTYHNLLLLPGNIYISSRYFEPENLVWVYPGHYRVFDIDMPDPVELEEIDTKEGKTVYITEDGSGERRKCE